MLYCSTDFRKDHPPRTTVDRTPPLSLSQMVSQYLVLASKESVLESESDTKLKSKSQPRLHRFPTPGSSGEAKELDEACCWGKENHDRLQALLRPALALPTWGTTKIPSRARAGTSVSQPHDPVSQLARSEPPSAVFAPPTLSGPGPDNPGSPRAHMRGIRVVALDVGDSES